MEDCPKEADKVVKVLKSISDGSNVDIISWIESFYHDDPPSNGRNQETESLEASPAEIRNDGTMELEDIFNGNETQ